MITQLMPRTTHPLQDAAGPLTAALSLAREFPHLPATSIEARGTGLLVTLFRADADHFGDWVTELRLAEEPASWHPYRDRMAKKLVAVGEYAEVEVRVMAYPDVAVAVAS